MSARAHVFMTACWIFAFFLSQCRASPWQNAAPMAFAGPKLNTSCSWDLTSHSRRQRPFAAAQTRRQAQGPSTRPCRVIRAYLKIDKTMVIKEGRGKVGRSVLQGPLTAVLLIVAACAVVGSMQVLACLCSGDALIQRVGCQLCASEANAAHTKSRFSL